MSGINKVYAGIKAISPKVTYSVAKPATRSLQEHTAAKLLGLESSRESSNKAIPLLKAFKNINLDKLGASFKELLGRFLGAQGDFCPWFPKNI